VGILLFLIGLLAAGSGAVKLMRGRASGDGRSAAFVEVVVGAAVVLGSGIGLARARPLAWTAVAAAIVAITMSSVVHVRAGLRNQATRAASEEARFRRYLGRPGATPRHPR
jgi:Kef-type K+ transport system membrane component KefB